jgi:CheY-like chemotaxis protein
MPKIVVVDDSKLMRHLLQRILEQAGHEVTLWNDLAASEVPERINAATPDLIITDYQMPGCNGLTLVRMARKTKPDLPVVVVTADRDPEVARGLAKLEVKHILYKPLQEAELMEAIRLSLEPVK